MDVTRFTDRLPAWARGPVELGVATLRDCGRDRVTGLAAEIAFWVILSIPPLLVAITAGAAVVGRSLGTDLRTGLLERVEELAAQVFSPGTVEAAVAPTLDALLRESPTSVLSISFLITVWTASRALWVVVHAVAIAYDLEEARPSWLSRVLGVGLTLAGLLLGVVLIPLVIAGPRLGEVVEDQLGVGGLALAEIWRVAYWPVSLVLVTLLVAGLYHWAAPWSTPFRRDLPGAVLATALGLVAALLLRSYTVAAFGGDAVYAPLAAPLAVLVFLYLQGLALLVGAELNAEIEKAHPSGAIVPDAPSLADLGRRALAVSRDLTGDGHR